MRVLVAEDERNTREALVSILEHMGHTATAVGDGLAAQAALASSNFQLLITDLRMPGLDGDAVIAVGLDLNPALRVIVISAYFRRSLDVLEPAQRAGLKFLVKPFRAADLRNVIHEIESESQTC